MIKIARTRPEHKVDKVLDQGFFLGAATVLVSLIKDHDQPELACAIAKNVASLYEFKENGVAAADISLLRKAGLR